MRMENPRKAFYGDLRPLGELLTSHDVLGIPITLGHHQRRQLVSEEDLEDLSGVSGMAVVGPTGELNDFTSTGFSVVVHTAGSDGEVGGDDCGELWGEG